LLGHCGWHDQRHEGDVLQIKKGIAMAGEIIVGPDTYHQAAGYFSFQEMESTKVEGRAEPIRIHKVLSPRERPSTTWHHHGLRSDLIGREVELAQLRERPKSFEREKERSSPFVVALERERADWLMSSMPL
jgi:hypothetical protein